MTRQASTYMNAAFEWCARSEQGMEFAAAASLYAVIRLERKGIRSSIGISTPYHLSFFLSLCEVAACMSFPCSPFALGRFFGILVKRLGLQVDPVEPVFFVERLINKSAGRYREGDQTPPASHCKWDSVCILPRYPILPAIRHVHVSCFCWVHVISVLSHAATRYGLHRYRPAIGDLVMLSECITSSRRPNGLHILIHFRFLSSFPPGSSHFEMEPWEAGYNTDNCTKRSDGTAGATQGWLRRRARSTHSEEKVVCMKRPRDTSVGADDERLVAVAR